MDIDIEIVADIVVVADAVNVVIAAEIKLLLLPFWVEQVLYHQGAQHRSSIQQVRHYCCIYVYIFDYQLIDN